MPMSRKVCPYMLTFNVLVSHSFMDALFDTESVFSLAALETKLVAYVQDPPAAQQPFDFASVPKISRAQAAQEAAREFLGFDFDLAATEEYVCQVRLRWIQLVFLYQRKQSTPQRLLQRRRNNQNTLNSLRTFPNLPLMVLCSIAVQHLPNLRRAKLNIKSIVSSIFSRSMLSSR